MRFGEGKRNVWFCVGAIIGCVNGVRICFIKDSVLEKLVFAAGGEQGKRAGAVYMCAGVPLQHRLTFTFGIATTLENLLFNGPKWHF